jgi:hypothetical protein
VKLEMIERLCADYRAQGKGHLEGHLVVWDEEIKARKEKKEKTRVQFEADNHDLYVSFNEEIHRIIKHVGNKAIALGMLLDWIKQLTNPVLDKLMASQEGPQ